MPKPPSPSRNAGEKFCVAFIIWLVFRCTDPSLFNWGDNKNRDGLGGALRGVGGTTLSTPGLGGILYGLPGIFLDPELDSLDVAPVAAANQMK